MWIFFNLMINCQNQFCVLQTFSGNDCCHSLDYRSNAWSRKQKSCFLKSILQSTILSSFSLFLYPLSLSTIFIPTHTHTHTLLIHSLHSPRFGHDNFGDDDDLDSAQIPGDRLLNLVDLCHFRFLWSLFGFCVTCSNFFCGFWATSSDLKFGFAHATVFLSRSRFSYHRLVHTLILAICCLLTVQVQLLHINVAITHFFKKVFASKSSFCCQPVESKKIFVFFAF